jgi:multisubunit Na+/H+ antiporter MnhF subunit
MKKIILYPFLFAVFPVLFLYSHNIKEVRLAQVFPALGILLVSSLLLWGIFLWIFKNKAKAALVTAVFILFFFSYGHIYDQLSYLDSALGIGLISHALLVPIFFVLWLLIAFLVFRSKKNFDRAVGFLNLTAITLILINVFNIALFNINRPGTPTWQAEILIDGKPVKNIEGDKIDRRDVYYIILDEYAGLNAVKKIYGYDNEPFIKELEKRGFYVASESKTRYNLSEKSMAASLNMRFLAEGDDPHKMIRNSSVAGLFKQLGYKIFIFPMNAKTVFSISDEVFEFTEIWFNDFNLMLLKTSMFGFLADIIVESGDYGRYYREKVLYAFDKLKTLPDIKEPTFVYAHIICPHYPFVFDENGRPTKPENFFNIRDKKYYLDQYIFTNKKIIDMVDSLLQRSEVPPVIIIQSDHGQRGTAPHNRSYRMDVGRSWEDIFNGYFLPGADDAYKELHPAMSPINSFRLVFNTYFHTDFPLLD